MTDVAAVRERRRHTEPTIVYLLTSAGPDGHRHCVAIDEEGNGETGIADGHRHAVVALDVAPGEDGHLHELDARRCFRGHPLQRPCER